jgi:hypothetical protein
MDGATPTTKFCWGVVLIHVKASLKWKHIYLRNPDSTEAIAARLDGIYYFFWWIDCSFTLKYWQYLLPIEQKAGTGNSTNSIEFLNKASVTLLCKMQWEAK